MLCRAQRQEFNQLLSIGRKLALIHAYLWDPETPGPRPIGLRSQPGSLETMTHFVATSAKSIGVFVSTTSSLIRGITRFPEALATAIERWAVK